MYRATTFTPTCTCRQHVRPPAIRFSPISLSGRAVRTLAIWNERSRQREAWRHLDDSLLEDIGVTREQAKREAEKPCWN
jgi:uncharacterized protein YjiS (DUF1127 family)